jgi:hypothetical protein
VEDVDLWTDTWVGIFLLLLCAGSSTANLLQALEDYLPVLVGLVKEGSQSRHSVQFVWTNQEDNAEVTLSSIIYDDDNISNC